MPVPPDGIRKDQSDLAQEGYLNLENVSRYQSDIFTRRPGLQDRNNVGGRVMVGLRESDGDDFIVRYTTDGKLQSAKTAYESTINELKTGLSTTAVGSFASMNGRTYYANGSDNMQTIKDGTTAAEDSGISAPGSITAAATTGGSMDAGVHLVRYRYYDSSTGYVSDPSTTKEVTTTASNDAINVTHAASGNSNVDKIIIEVTAADGSVFYDATVVNNASTTTAVTSSDVTLEQQQRRAQGADTGNAPPPTFSIVTEHSNRLFGIDGQTLYWSGAGRPEGWSTVDQARTVFNSNDDEATGLYSVYTDLYIFGLNSMHRLAYTSNPTTGKLSRVPTHHGLWNQRCLVQVGSDVYGWGPEGMWMIHGLIPRPISMPIDKLLADVDQSKSAQFHGVHDPVENVVMWFYLISGDTDPQQAFCYDLGTRSWSKRDYGHGIPASCNCIDSANLTRAALSTDDDTQWVLKRDRFDGVLNGEVAVVTAQAGATGTVIDTNETMQTSQTLKGVLVYQPSSGESKIVSTNTATKLTMASAFTTAPVAGEELWIGTSEIVIEPKWLAVDQAAIAAFRMVRLHLQFIADTSDQTTTMRVYFYKDLSTNSLSWTTNDSDTPPEGMSITDGQSYGEAWLYGETGDGHVAVPGFGDWARRYRFKLTTHRPGSLFQLETMRAVVNPHDRQKVHTE